MTSFLFIIVTIILEAWLYLRLAGSLGVRPLPISCASPLAITHQKTIPPPHLLQSRLKLSYWCSWYAYGWDISPEVILKEAKAIKNNHLAIDCILIDDGWQLDWLIPLSQQLHSLGFQVGIWYAPYTRHQHLPLHQTLDELINGCNLDVLKLDFLYKPYFDRRLGNPSQLLNDLFTHLSIHYPRLITIGCGVPFHDAINRVSTIRVSKDIAFPPYFPTFFNRQIYRHRVTMLYQKYLAWEAQKLFTPDPDVRMFSLDTPKTVKLWSEMSLLIKGVGDKISQLKENDLKKVRLWLKK